MIAVKPTLSMLLIGGSLWLLFAGYTQFLIRILGVHHSPAEVSAIPLSALLYYGLVTKLVFHQLFYLRQFVSFALVTSFGWLAFLTTTAIIVDIIRLDTAVGLLGGMIVNASVNIIVQQAVTWKRQAR